MCMTTSTFILECAYDCRCAVSLFVCGTGDGPHVARKLRAAVEVSSELGCTRRRYARRVRGPAVHVQGEVNMLVLYFQYRDSRFPYSYAACCKYSIASVINYPSKKSILSSSRNQINALGWVSATRYEGSTFILAVVLILGNQCISSVYQEQVRYKIGNHGMLVAKTKEHNLRNASRFHVEIRNSC